MPITSWPENERPREKLLSKGAATLSNAELLAILFRNGIKNKNAVELARELLIKFGGLNNLLAASKKQLCNQAGVGPTKYAQLQAALELAKRQLEVNLQKKDFVNDSLAAKRFLIAHLSLRKQEIFSCIFLDNSNKIICYEELFFGSINHSTIYPREVVQRALQHNAAAVVLAHNHPSGAIKPSAADIKLTEQLAKALQLVEIKVLDHIIVAGNTTISLFEKGIKW